MTWHTQQMFEGENFTFFLVYILRFPGFTQTYTWVDLAYSLYHLSLLLLYINLEPVHIYRIVIFGLIWKHNSAYFKFIWIILRTTLGGALLVTPFRNTWFLRDCHFISTTLPLRYHHIQENSGPNTERAREGRVSDPRPVFGFQELEHR